MMRSKTVNQLLQHGYADSPRIRHLLACLLNLEIEIPELVTDLNCCEGWLTEILDCHDYRGFSASVQCIHIAKQRYPKYADKFAAVDVFRYSNGGADVIVCLGLLHHHHDPILGLSQLQNLWQPKIFYVSFITSITAVKDIDDVTVIPLEDINSLPNLVGVASFQIMDNLFWTIVEQKWEEQ